MIHAIYVRLGLALDGVNPFGDLSSCDFIRLMILLNYNLPLWMVSKLHFLILALIIPSKESVTFGNINVYLQMLIKELQMMWKGVQAFIAYSKKAFTLKNMCMWSIRVFLAYGLFVSCVIKGHVGCPPCGPTTESCFSKKLKTKLYGGSWRYLPWNHLYQRIKTPSMGKHNLRLHLCE